MAQAQPQIPVRQITSAEVIPLRHEVLRPGRPRETAIFSGDDLATTTHWGAFTAEGRLVAVASLLRAPMPGTDQPAWQIRGMASSPSVRGQGYGAAVLREIAQYVRAQGRTSASDAHGRLWCNARKSAEPFYRSQGFKIEGAEFDIVGIGPHFVMTCELFEKTP